MNSQVGMDTRLRDLTVGEFLDLIGRSVRTERFVTGLGNIARVLGVSDQTVRRRLAEGGYSGVITKDGRIYTLDTEKLK